MCCIHMLLDVSSTSCQQGQGVPSLQLMVHEHVTRFIFAAGAAVYTRDARLNDDYLGSKQEEPERSSDNDTIAAIVTAMGGQHGAVAIVRLSGTSAVEIVGRMFQPAGRTRTSPPRSEWTPESHRVQYGNLVDTSGSLIDEVNRLEAILLMIFG